jgi:hypothetical protein
VPASDRGGNEYALRAGSVTRYPWGDSPGEGEANCDGCGSRWDLGQTAPVGSFQPNAFGLYDMQGNVWEWVEDAWHGNYDGALRTGRDGFKATQTAGSSAAVPGATILRLFAPPSGTSANIHVRVQHPRLPGGQDAKSLIIEPGRARRSARRCRRPAEPSTSTNLVKHGLGCAVEGRGLGVRRKKFGERLSIANEVVRFW